MSVKRPRIREDLADRIHAAKGLVPFEPYVNAALELALRLDEGDWEATFDELIGKVPADELLHHLLMEGYGWHWPDIQPALDRMHERWQQSADKAAIEQEHDE